MQVERVDFVAVPVADLERADAFYGETLGLARNPNSSGERWVEYETPNVTFALSTFGGTIAFRVPDVEKARAVLEEAGVQFAGEVFDSGVCHGAPFIDPDGNSLLLHHRYAPLEPWVTPPTEVQRTDFAMIVTQDIGAYASTARLSASPAAERAPRLGRVRDRQRHACGHDSAHVRLEFEPLRRPIALRVPDVAAAKPARGGGTRGRRDVGLGHLPRGRRHDPAGNRILLHRRYAPYPDGTMP